MNIESNTVDWEISVVNKISSITLNDENQTSEIFSSTYKWSNLLWLSGHSDKNKARQKFNRQNIFPAKNSGSTVHIN